MIQLSLNTHKLCQENYTSLTKEYLGLSSVPHPINALKENSLSKEQFSPLRNLYEKFPLSI